MIIKVLGPGCKNCKNLEKNTLDALNKGDGTFAPKADLSRAESMVVISKLIELK